MKRKEGEERRDWVKRRGRKQKRRIMKNFVLLIAPPSAPPTPPAIFSTASTISPLLAFTGA